MTYTTQPAPVGEGERIHALDALRGIALLGILMVNMGSFKGLSTLDQFPRPESLVQPADQTAFLLIQTLFTGKFYPIFAFLFGLGFALQIERLQARGVNATGIMLRRLLVLLGFGLLHGLFIWTGDVLFLYALCGMVLLLFARLSPRAVLYWVLGLWGVQLLCCLSCSGVTFWWAATEDAQAAGGDFFTTYIEQGRQAYAQSSYWVAQQFRFVEWLVMQVNAIFILPDVLLMFLIGLYFGKSGVFGQLDAYRRTMGWLAVAGIPIGIALNALYATGVQNALRNENELQAYGWLTLGILFGPVLALGYVGAFCWLWSTAEGVQRLLAPVAAAGRMALTNYLTQSVVCTLLFYGYGLGLHAKVGVAQGAGIALALWGVQVVVSMLWLAQHAYGPMEWLWRSLTYGRRMPLQRVKQAETP
ncbi:MAG: DUF418 domain-containing protein [Fimbriimonadales bacterium]|nr:MAG: hypothetical protein KatS3mg018_0519 [Fimbriimonadales bacterium]